LEFIAEIKLRDALNLKDGDIVSIEFWYHKVFYI
jgi:CTP-dependent riboflavin kinase